MKLLKRSYRGVLDLEVMQALLQRYQLSDYFPSASDLPEILDPSVSDTPHHAVLWEDDPGKIQGFAIIDPYHNLYFFISPNYWTDDFENELEEWFSLEGQSIASSLGSPVVLSATARDHESQKKHFLLAHGFLPVAEQTLHMSRSLVDPFPDPVLPPGFRLRLLAGEGEVDAYVAIHRLAYGTEMMTREMRLAIMRQPYYRPDLDLIIETPHQIVAFCVCSINEDENRAKALQKGEISIVGVHPEFHGCGLGRAAVLAGLQAPNSMGWRRPIYRSQAQTRQLSGFTRAPVFV